MLRTVTFFNEKGGSGKTTFAAIFSSFLAYKLREKVFGVLDFDSPSYHLDGFRGIDRFYNIESNRVFHKMCLDAGAPYPVEAIKSDGTFTEEQLSMMARQIRKRKESEDGYLILDFPGSLRPGDPVFRFAKEGLLDLMVIPITADSQTRVSALRVYSMMHSSLFKSISGKDEGQATLFFWNEVTLTEERARQSKYDNYERKLTKELNIKVCNTRVRQIPVLRRDPDNPLVFVRSTMCYPEANIRRYCPYIEDLFMEIKNELDAQSA